MIYPEKMSRVTIVSPKVHIKEVVDALYELKVLHIKDYLPEKEVGVTIGAPLSDAEKISELILDLYSIKSQIALPKIVAKQKQVSKPPKVAYWNSMKAMEKYLKSVKSRVTRLNLEIKRISEGMKALEKEKEQLEFLLDVGIASLDALSSYANFDLVFGYTKNVSALNQPESRVISSAKAGKVYSVAVLVKKDKRQLLAGKIEEVKIDVRGHGKADAKIKEIAREMQGMEKKKGKIEKELQKVAEDEGGKINYIESLLLQKIKKSEAPLKFASSEYDFFVNGWVPERNAAALAKRLSEISENIFVKFEKAGEEDVPTKIRNPPPIRSFEFFLNLYSLPRYNEIDPSFLVFITFPLFFGFMLGDIGYGAVLLALGSIARTRMKHALIDITIIASLSTIFFGFVYGESFGAEHVMGIELHPYLHRIGQVNQLITLSAVIGLVHLNIGFIFGFVNELKHGFARAFMAKISWIGLQLAGILFLLDMLKYISISVYIPLAVGIASFLMILKTEGMLGLVELPSIISNILSYLRLGAVGLASAALALVVNKLAGSMFQQGGIMLIAGIVILVLGHAINLALGILSSFLHSMRLHYVEMFTKFYSGSGKRYEPFGE